jgi:hypothetical protein
MAKNTTYPVGERTDWAIANQATETCYYCSHLADYIAHWHDQLLPKSAQFDAWFMCAACMRRKNYLPGLPSHSIYTQYNFQPIIRRPKEITFSAQERIL